MCVISIQYLCQSNIHSLQLFLCKSGFMKYLTSTYVTVSLQVTGALIAVRYLFVSLFLTSQLLFTNSIVDALESWPPN